MVHSFVFGKPSGRRKKFSLKGACCSHVALKIFGILYALLNLVIKQQILNAKNLSVYQCTFSEACSEELTIVNIKDSSIDSFTEKLIAIAENTIPKSKPHNVNKFGVTVTANKLTVAEGKRKSEQKSLQQLKTWNISESNGPNAEKLSEPLADTRGKPLSLQ